MKTTAKAFAKQVSALSKLELALDDAIASCEDAEERANLREQLRGTVELRQRAEHRVAFLADKDRSVPACKINHAAMMAG